MTLKYDDQPVVACKRLYRCPSCGDGHLEDIGIILPIMPPLYKHRCLQCKCEFVLPEPNGSIHYKYTDEVSR